MTEVVQRTSVFVGVDTHADIHHVAVVDPLGRSLSDRTFPTTAAGYEQVLRWCTQFGDVVAVGIEGTSSYGAALTRHLRQAEMNVVEVDRPDRKCRRLHGKTDALDAYSAARAVAAGRATAAPKAKDGPVECIRCLHVARRSAVKARTQAINQIRGVLTTGPVQLREQMRGLGTKALIGTVARLRPTDDAGDPAVAVKIAIRSLARRCQDLNEEIGVLNRHLSALTAQAAPALLERPGLGVDTVARLLITAGDNPERLRSEAAFARLTGVAPIPASSGRTDWHRPSRGGDRQANRALNTVVLVRMHRDARTQEYVQRRTEQGLGKKDIIRCLKRLDTFRSALGS